MMSHKKNMILGFIDSVCSLFLTGLLTLLPITLTIAVFTITFRLLLSWLEPLKRFGLPFIGIIPYSVAFFKLSYKIILILIFGFIKRLVSNLSIVLIKNIIKYTIKRL